MSRTPFPKRAGCCLLLVACIAACRSDDVNGSVAPVTGTYVLRAINGAALPAFANGPHMTEFKIVADTLRLDGNGNGVEVMVRSRPGEPVEHESVSFKLAASNDRDFRVDYVCPDGGALAACVAGPHHVGRFTSLGLTFEGSVMYRVPMVYERLMQFADGYIQGGKP